MWFENRRRALPKFRSCVLTLAELELATCSGLTGLLTLNLAGIAGQESGLLQHRTHLGVNLAQCASDTQTSGFGLSLDATAIEVDSDVVALDSVGSQQRLLYLELENLEREIGGKLLVVDCNLTLARLHEYASHSGLTTTYGVYNFHNSSYLISFNLICLGFCAACGCSAPAYTLRFLSCAAPRRVRGIMPLTAFSIKNVGFLTRYSAGVA